MLEKVGKVLKARLYTHVVIRGLLLGLGLLSGTRGQKNDCCWLTAFRMLDLYSIIGERYLFCLYIVTPCHVTGVILRMNGSYIPNHDRIVITDIKPTEALTCYSELLSCNNSLQSGEWYLNNHAVARDFGGWKVDKETVSDHQLVRLRKVSDSAMEGEFTCYIRGDIIPSASVEMYHPSELNQSESAIILILILQLDHWWLVL